MLPEAKPGRYIEVELGERKLTVSRGASNSVFYYTSRLKSMEKMRKNDLPDAHEGCACSTRGSRTELYYQNDMIIVFFCAAYKNKESTQVALLSSNA